MEEYTLNLIYNGKYVFAIEIGGIEYKKRFSGHFNGKSVLSYIKQKNMTKDEAIEYVNGERIFSTLYPVEMNSYYPFLKQSFSPCCYEILENKVILKDNYEIDTENFTSKQWQNFSVENEECEVINDDNTEYHVEYSGACEGSYYFNTAKHIPIEKEYELYYELSNGDLLFKGVFKNNKVLYWADKTFLDDFSITEEYKNSILNSWN